MKMINRWNRVIYQLWAALNLVAIDDFSKMRINLLHTLAGTDQPGKKQVLLERKALQDLNVAVGEPLLRAEKVKRAG